MSFGRRLTRTVTVLTASNKTDRYGNTVADWTTFASRSVNAWIAPLSTVENLIGRDETTAIAVIFLPAGDPLTAVDRVRIEDGTVYEIDGEPFRTYEARRGVEHHVQARLKDVEG